MSVILEHAELCGRILRELTHEEWCEAIVAGTAAAKAAYAAESKWSEKSEVSLKATNEAYREALRRKESK
mgnify:FL=1